MKKIASLLLFSFLLFAETGFGQNSKLEQAVEAQILALQQMGKFQSISIGVGGENEEDELDSFSFENYPEFSPTFFDSLDIKQQRDFPYTFLEVDYNKYKLSEMLGEDNFYFGENPSKIPEFIPQTVTFFNGKTANAKDIFVQGKELEKLRKKDEEIDKTFTSAFYKKTEFVLKTVQPIQSVTFLLKTDFDEMKDFFADKNTSTIKTEEGEIQISDFMKNQVTITYPKSMAEHFNVYGIYKNGKYLSEKGKSSKSSSYTKEQIEVMTKVLTEALSEIKANKIQSEKELKKYLENHLSKEIVTPKEPQTETTVYYFAGNLNKIKIGLKKKGNQKTERTVTYFASDYFKKKYSENRYIVCTDRTTGKYGIIDLNGNWIVKPEYEGLGETGTPNHFEMENDENWYRLDVENKKLVKTDYKIVINHYGKDHNGKIIAEHITSKKSGVIEELTGKVIIPFEYDNIRFLDGEFFKIEKYQKGNDLEGIINFNNEIIIPAVYENIKWVNPLFIVPGGYSTDVQDFIFDKTGKLLTDQYHMENSYSSFKENQLLLVKTFTPIEESEIEKYENWSKIYSNNQETYVRYFYHFMDENGKIKFSIDMDKYKKVKEFYNGLSAITTIDGKMGYINTDGKLVIPAIYKESLDSNFYGKYALVEKDDEHWFIDQEGKLINKIDDRPSSSDGKTIRLYNGDVYNYDGERIKEGENKQPKQIQKVYHLPAD